MIPVILAIIQQQPPASAPGSPAVPSAEQSPVRDIAPPVDVPAYPPWVHWSLGILAAIVVAVAIWLLVRWFRNRPQPPPPTPRAIALRELERLRPQVRSSDPYAFSIAVSDVLRHFIDAQYGLRSERQTSPEFLATLADNPTFGEADRRLLAEFLERCDLLKFARVAADESANEQLLGSAAAFVQGGRAA